MTAHPPRQPPRPPRPPRPKAPAAPAASRVVTPLSERELDELQDLLDRVPAPLEPLDVSMLDGYLCGVLLQPQRMPVSRWWRHVVDADGRALPPRFDASRLQALVLRRHDELDDAIGRRQWFDPWVFELGAAPDAQADTGADAAPRAKARDADLDAGEGRVGDRDRDDDDGNDNDNDNDDDDDDDDDASAPEVDAVYPWVAGFAHALECFPGLMALDAQALTEPLALMYRHLDADDLEDADELLAEIESMQPPADLAEAVEGLVRATLLFADVSRPRAAAGGGSGGGSGGAAGGRAAPHAPPRGRRPSDR